MENQLIKRAEAYMAAIERDADAAELETFYAPDILSEELPNRLVPKGGVRDLAALQKVNSHGRGMFISQTYEIVNAIEAGDQVVLETVWTGVLKVALGSLQPGQTMQARSAQIFQFRDGLIWRQRTYDSFTW